MWSAPCCLQLPNSKPGSSKFKFREKHWRRNKSSVSVSAVAVTCKSKSVSQPQTQSWVCCTATAPPLININHYLQLPNSKPGSSKFKFREKHWRRNKSSVSVSAVAVTCKSKSVSQPQTQSWVCCTATAPPLININHYKPPELGLLSLLFVLSTAIGAVLSLAIIAVPTMMAFRKLGISADKLSKVVSEEVPGTLSSLKLSGLEINELTQQLTTLRQKISGIRGDNKARSNKPKPTSSSTSSIVN